MKKIYLAGPFSWQSKILARAQKLQELGYIITAEWLTQEISFTRPDNSTVIERPGLHADCQEISNRDIKNILDSDTLILFDPGVPLERVTRVAEFGIALGTGKQCIVIQPEDILLRNVISSAFVKFKEVPLDLQHRGLKPVKEFPTWEDFLSTVGPIPKQMCRICDKVEASGYHGYCPSCWGAWYR